jgi:GH43 family beta-xylosidase
MRRTLVSILAAGLLATTAAAADLKTYQVTGPVTDVGSDSITVQKGKENWQIARSGSTKGPADVKKGDKVTVYYQMTATEIEAKPAAPAKTSKKK